MADLEKKEEKSRQWKPYSCSELSAFCLQVSLLLEAAVPLDEGFSIMAEDAADEKERQMLLYMSEGAELGDPCFKIFKDTGVFPDYVIRMAKLGQETGTLDQMMKSLSDYYEKEDRLIKTLKNAVRYPAMMILMLLVVLFVLFVKVMPIFSKVYEQVRGGDVTGSPVSYPAGGYIQWCCTGPVSRYSCSYGRGCCCF